MPLKEHGNTWDGMYSHRSSTQRSVYAGWTAQRPRWGASAWPCLQSCHTWEGSSAGCHRPSRSESEEMDAGRHEEDVANSLGFSIHHCRWSNDHSPSHLWFQQWLCHRWSPWSQSRCTPLFHQGPRLASYLKEQQRVWAEWKTLHDANVGRDNKKVKKTKFASNQHEKTHLHTGRNI